jgi:hypothetical protein
MHAHTQPGVLNHKTNKATATASILTGTWGILLKENDLNKRHDISS